MHPVLALFAPDCAIERRKRQTRTHIYRPDNGDPTHRIVATNFEVLFVSWIANLTEGHLPTGNRVANANLLIRGSLIIPLLLKIPRLNVFSENCEEKWIFIEFERFVKKKSVAFRVGDDP